MALSGVRGFSTINSPIEDRMPVQTYVIRKESHAIKEIIERELARNGQVFYLNNRIESLNSIATHLSKLVKNAKIAIAHGKLSVEQMEDIMQRFINNEFNILLCTTIVENGIDIPNVNTIIVGGNDRGVDLSELIQFLNDDKMLENIICLPKTGEYIKEGLENSGKNVVFKEKLEDAVEYAMEITKKGTACLLSPAASSYGYFKNFEERGKLFKKYVLDGV